MVTDRRVERQTLNDYCNPAAHTHILLVLLIAELQNINHTHYLYHSTINRQFFDNNETLVGEKYNGTVVPVIKPVPKVYILLQACIYTLYIREITQQYT